MELSAEKDAFLDRLVMEGLFPDRSHALERALELLREATETERDIRDGLLSVSRGEGTSLDEAIERLREKLDIPNDTDETRRRVAATKGTDRDHPQIAQISQILSRKN